MIFFNLCLFINKKMIYLQPILYNCFLLDKINYLLDCMEGFDEDGNGKLYKSILVNTYFTCQL